jgi:hypothetical protein
MVSGMQAGRTTYYCENCGALVIMTTDGIEVFHVHRGSMSDRDRCHNDVPDDAKSLKEKLEEMQQRDYERLKEV